MGPPCWSSPPSDSQLDTAGQEHRSNRTTASIVIVTLTTSPSTTSRSVSLRTALCYIRPGRPGTANNCQFRSTGLFAGLLRPTSNNVLLRWCDERSPGPSLTTALVVIGQIASTERSPSCAGSRKSPEAHGGPADLDLRWRPEPLAFRWHLPGIITASRVLATASKRTAPAVTGQDAESPPPR